MSFRNVQNIDQSLKGKKTLKRFALVAVLALSAAGIGTAPASASVVAPVSAVAPTAIKVASSLTYYYPVYGYKVCRRQGHWGSSFTNYWNPYSGYCYDLSFPIGITWAGGMDINGWCKATYPGSYAGIYANNALGWKCIKRVY